MVPSNICSIENCSRKYHAKGYCNLHYHKYLKQNLILTNSAKYYKTEKGKLSARKAKKKQIDSGLNNFYNAKRRAAELQATPKWLTSTQLTDIKQVYTNCPSGYTVDHIIPLQNEIVSGLHVPWNLQYLTPSENSQKRNKI